MCQLGVYTGEVSMKTVICIGQGNTEMFYEITSPHNEPVIIGLSAITGVILIELVENLLQYFEFKPKLMQRIIVSHLLMRRACYTIDLLSHDVQTSHRIYTSVVIGVYCIQRHSQSYPEKRMFYTENEISKRMCKK
jgi:hypothetical protein